LPELIRGRPIQISKNIPRLQMLAAIVIVCKRFYTTSTESELQELITKLANDINGWKLANTKVKYLSIVILNIS
jgi:hypothetical protein